MARSIYQGPGHRPGGYGDPLARKERLVRPAGRRSFPAGPGTQPITLVFAAGRGEGVDQRERVSAP
jgi:hypothetical protein